MSIITAIETQEKYKNRRSIFLDGQFAAGVDESVVLALNLKVGKDISQNELNAIIHAELINKAKERALTLLDYRKRSRFEIQQRLKKANFENDIIEEVIQTLEEAGFVDDADFSESWVKGRTSGKGMGKNRIKWELKQKGIDNAIADEALASVDPESEYETALNSAKNRWQKDKDPDVRAKKRRLASYLSRQGFGWDTINRAINYILEEEQSDM